MLAQHAEMNGFGVLPVIQRDECTITEPQRIRFVHAQGGRHAEQDEGGEFLSLAAVRGLRSGSSARLWARCTAFGNRRRSGMVAVTARTSTAVLESAGTPAACPDVFRLWRTAGRDG